MLSMGPTPSSLSNGFKGMNAQSEGQTVRQTIVLIPKTGIFVTQLLANESRINYIIYAIPAKHYFRSFVCCIKLK